MTIPDHESAQAAGRFSPGTRVRLILAWLLIVAAVSGIFVRQFRSRGEAGAASNGQPDISVEITARYVVGAHEFFARMAIRREEAARLLEALESREQTAADRIRVAIVAGELVDAEAARQRLAALRAGSPVVREDVGILQTLYQNGPAALSPEQRARLLARYEWFGQLALAYGLPASDPARQAVMGPAIRTMVTLLGGLVGIGILCLVGVVLLILASVFAMQGKIRAAYTSTPPFSSAYLESFALYLAAMVGGSLLLSLLVPARQLWMSGLVLLLTPLALLWPQVVGVPASRVRYTLGLHTGRGVLREMGAGVAGYIAGFPLLVLAALITLGLARFTHTQPTHPVVYELTRGPWHVAEVFCLASIWAPVMEELFFRGAFFAHLRQRWSFLVSALTVALIFAAIHPQGWVAIPPLAVLATTFAALRQWRGSIIACVTAHALNNTAVLLFALLMLA